MVGKTQNILNCTITLMLRRPPAKFCLIAKTTGAAWRAMSSIYQITRSERAFYAQLFLELSNFISSHHYDTLIHKVLSHDELRFVKFHILARFSFLSPSEGRAGPSRRSHARATL